LHAFLSHAFLSHAFLSHAFLSHAFLSHAFLSHAFLSHAFLSHDSAMSEIVLALKNEGNVFFNEKKYAEAIAKYDTPIRVLADEPIPGLQLTILTSRLNAYNKIYDTSAQPMNDVLALLKAWPHDLLEPVFSDDKICKAVYQASLSQQSRGKFMEAATMLRACLRHKPNDKSVLAALSRVENSRSEGLEKLKQYRVGPVKDLCIQGERFLCDLPT
jgi:tetratricopeptide (TPR) repeat protein